MHLGTAHNHDHAHTRGAANYGTAFVVGIALNIGFVLLEVGYGWKSDSLSLLADAGHKFGDVGGLLLAWAAYGAGKLPPSARYTYGWRRGSILSGFINAGLLLVAIGSLAWEAVLRLRSPEPIDAPVVMGIAAIGVLVNAATAWLFVGGMRDLNIRGAFLHMAADALISLGVVFAGGLYLWLGWTWLDPAVSLLIALVVVLGAWSLLRRSLHLLFDGVPDDIDTATVRQRLLDLAGVAAVHDLHIWAISTAENALTAHLVVDSETVDRDSLVERAQHMLHEQFALRHVCLQCESAAYAQKCPLHEK